MKNDYVKRMIEKVKKEKNKVKEVSGRQIKYRPQLYGLASRKRDLGDNFEVLTLKDRKENERILVLNSEDPGKRKMYKMKGNVPNSVSAFNFVIFYENNKMLKEEEKLKRQRVNVNVLKKGKSRGMSR